MRLASHRLRPVGLILAALLALSVASCASNRQPWSPEVEKTYKEIYHPIIDGG